MQLFCISRFHSAKIICEKLNYDIYMHRFMLHRSVLILLSSKLHWFENVFICGIGIFNLILKREVKMTYLVRKGTGLLII